MLDEGDRVTAWVHEHQPDLVLLDLMLPGKDGSDICQDLKLDRRTNLVPIIMVTVRDQPQDRVHGLQVGANAYLTKPFATDQLHKAIQEVLSWRADLESHGAAGEVHFHLLSELRYLEQLNQMLGSLFLFSGLSQANVRQLITAVRELGTNAIEWGHRRQVDRIVTVTYRIDADKVTMVIRDAGPGFDPRQVPHAAHAEDPLGHLEVRESLGLREGGFGILMARGLVDDLQYNETGNEVRLIKHFLAGAQVVVGHVPPGLDGARVPAARAVEWKYAQELPWRPGELTDEEIRTWTLEEKDLWWLKNVYRGNMPQLTLRSAITGMLLGGLLSLTNLYVGAKTGWTLGVGITSVILAFAMFKVLSSLHLANEFSILENNAMQSIATAAGYMTSPLISSLAAYMMVTGQVLPMYQTMLWMILLAILGVLFAFPFKRRFINDEQQPFPEGRAAGIVMDALHHGEAHTGLLKAKLLVCFASLAAVVKFLQSEAILAYLSLKQLTIPEFLDEWAYRLMGYTPTILGTPVTTLTLRPELDLPMIGVGGLMGIRTGASLLLGAFVNYAILAPLMIQQGDILPKDGKIGFREITLWSLWCGVAMMTVASLFTFFARPQILVSAFSKLLGRRRETTDVLAAIELPLWVSALGIPLLGAGVVAMAQAYFGVELWLSVVAVILVFAFCLIAINSTGLTSITPIGAMGKLTQLTFGAIAPGNIRANLATASITGEVASHAANLLQDIKPGYMLGAKPRQQAMGHVLGVLAGAVLSVPIFSTWCSSSSARPRFS